MEFIKQIVSLLDSKERVKALWLLLLIIIGMFMEMLGIGLVVPALVLLIENDIASSYPQVLPILELIGNPPKELLISYALIALISLYVIKTFFLAFLVWTQSSFSFGVGENVSKRLFEKYLHQPYIFHLERNSAQLIRNTTMEVHHFSATLAQLLIFSSELMVIVGIGALFIVVEPIGSLVIVLTLGFASWLFQNITKNRIEAWGNTRQLSDEKRIQHLQQGLGGVKDAKILGREKEFLNQFEYPNRRLALIARNMATVQGLPRLWLELITVFSLVLLIVFLVNQSDQLTEIIPILGLFAAGAFRLMPSSNRLISAIQQMRFSIPIVQTLAEEFLLDIPSKESNLSSIEFEDLIEVKEISFSYPNTKVLALNNINFKIKKGETIGIIGESGSGKSTLIDIILGLLDPAKGQIIIDNQSMHLAKRNWQNKIGYVPQTIFLNDESLKRNIAFGLPEQDIDEGKIKQTILAAQLEEYIETLPDGIETSLGERGVRMSGGQRQRIGIARALYHGPDVLVLDEATSSLDNETESEVMAAIEMMRGEKTIIIVAHRLSTVKNTDRLINLEKGVLIKEGTFKEIVGSIT